MTRVEELKFLTSLNRITKHLSDAEVIFWHDHRFTHKEDRRRVKVHLQICDRCYERVSRIVRIHLTEEEMMLYRDEAFKNKRTQKRVTDHLKKFSCQLCMKWLEALYP